MAKKKIINGVLYTPLKRHAACQCENCHKIIDFCEPAYFVRRGQADSLSCRKCVLQMEAHERASNDRGASEYPKNKSIKVGTKHNCGKQVYAKKTFIFIHENKTEKITMNQCPVCSDCFLDRKIYDKHPAWFYEYDLINSSTGAKIIRPTKAEGFVRTFTMKKEDAEIPDSVRWSATHPYQGGGCSGK